MGNIGNSSEMDMNMTTPEVTSILGLPNEVLQHLFLFLDFKSLKLVREACGKFNANALQISKKKCKCKMIILDFEHCTKFIETMEKATDIPFDEFLIDFEIGSRYDKMKEMFILLGPSLKKLTIWFDCSGGSGAYKLTLSAADLVFMLTSCTNLKKLKLKGDYNWHAQQPLVAITDDHQFATITQIHLNEIYDSATDFSISKECFSQLVRTMPNISHIALDIRKQDHFDSFITQLEASRGEGLLKKLNELRLTVAGNNKVYFAQKHMNALISSNLRLKSLEFLWFTYRRCHRINNENISSESFHHFFLENSQSLKECYFGGGFRSKPIEQLNFPIMPNLKSLQVDMQQAMGILPNVNLANLFPNLKDLSLHTDWEPHFDTLFPWYEDNKWTCVDIKIPRADNENAMRTIQLYHNTVDYFFEHEDFFGCLNNWFPSIKIVSAEVFIHFGLLNLLRGLCHTNIEEIDLQVSCTMCKEAEPDDIPMKSDYESLNHYRLGLTSTLEKPFPVLRIMNISLMDCGCVSFDYLHNSDVMKLITSAPLLSSITINGIYSDLVKPVVTTYHK